MCGRYSVSVKAHEAASELAATVAVDALPERYNLAPTDDAPIVVERGSGEAIERRIGLARFGLVPSGSEGPKAVGAKYINLRAEGVASQKAFAESAKHRRCLVLADGFYEWKKEGAGKQAWYVRREGGGLITFAGIWDVWGPPEGEGDRVPSFAILTTKPSEMIAELHDRMPIVVPPHLRAKWLSGTEEDAKALLRELRDADPVPLEAWKVSLRVGNVRNDDPTLREPIDGERRRSRKG
jgi:putative SOS response-associated peptidase YedK